MCDPPGWKSAELRACLFWFAGSTSLFAAGFDVAFSQATSPSPEDVVSHARSLLLATAAGVVVGTVLLALQTHPRRRLGQVPFGATLLTIALLGVALAEGAAWPQGLSGCALALIALPLHATIRAGLPNEYFKRGLLATYGLALLMTVGLCGTSLGLLVNGWPSAWRASLLTLLAGLGTMLVWRRWYREALEQFMEIILWPIYRIRAYGPGQASFPPRGPVLVVSNHAAWFDPLWLGKVIPRRIIPMMTSLFYDLPVLRWLMVYVVQAIRVQDSGFRRDVPELDEAVQALDRGECVVIFPEGRVRRKEAELLRQFGQGVWHILQRRPETPVVVCWIEGGWGSYFSYDQGPPMKNKRIDWWRHIRVGLSEPRVLDAALLAEHRATRHYLRQACLETRQFLGLAPAETEVAEDAD